MPGRDPSGLVIRGFPGLEHDAVGFHPVHGEPESLDAGVASAESCHRSLTSEEVHAPLFVRRAYLYTDSGALTNTLPLTCTNPAFSGIADACVGQVPHAGHQNPH